ncbi:hypothetical protein GA0116948_105169 [Chitinophaga costaii]|uniref:Uncharacterized protein n=1 Tax=Chitinophaga costaii TaxID=1335309 RepID=A0A1C4DAT1_9BACT|nr:hypothetical protein GA0116948_105169 [Chitinophaga costaii]
MIKINHAGRWPIPGTAALTVNAFLEASPKKVVIIPQKNTCKLPVFPTLTSALKMLDLPKLIFRYLNNV